MEKPIDATIQIDHCHHCARSDQRERLIHIWGDVIHQGGNQHEHHDNTGHRSHVQSVTNTLPSPA